MNDFSLCVCVCVPIVVVWIDEKKNSTHRSISMRMMFGNVETNGWQRLNHIDIFCYYYMYPADSIDYFATRRGHSLKRSMTFNFQQSQSNRSIHVVFWYVCASFSHQCRPSYRSLQFIYRSDSIVGFIVWLCRSSLFVRFSMRQYLIMGIVCDTIHRHSTVSWNIFFSVVLSSSLSSPVGNRRLNKKYS